MNTATAYTGNKKIHPHKFALWVAMASITMMFAGLTSAYMVRQAQGNWRYFHLPVMFWYSTAVIVASSATIILAIRAFRQRRIPQYRMLLLATLALGLAFCLMQFKGFYDLANTQQPVRMNGQVLDSLPVKLNGNPSESFLLIIAGLHIAHILGGVVALFIAWIRSFSRRTKIYNTTGIEIVAGYWHFVDVLWLYLFVFFLVNQ